MNLLLEIEFLSGVCFAAIGPDSDQPDWPPQPDRVFSALVATWGSRGEQPNETLALKWLEALPTPRIICSSHFARTAPVSFVPPNDPSSGRSGDIAVMPSDRPRQARRFPAARPDVSIMSLCWPDAQPNESTMAALMTLASDTSYVGHSSSLVRCHFRIQSELDLSASISPARWVYPGRLEELRAAYQVFVATNGMRGRPLPGQRVPPEEPECPKTGAFASRWLILEHVSVDDDFLGSNARPNTMPDLRACALVAKAIRATLLSAYKRLGLENSIPEIVSGHGASGEPSYSPHLAIIPLPFAGFPHADGHVMGFALVPPAESQILKDQVFLKALRTIAPLNESVGRRVLVVSPRGGSARADQFAIALSPTFEPPLHKRSLDPALYTRPSRMFSSVTPILLDRHLKNPDGYEEEMIEQVIQACRNIGLPAPESARVDKHPVFEGVPSAYPSTKSPVWMGWRLPATLGTRKLTHAVIRFSEPVHGPLLLGAGRYHGLGLLRPLDPAR